MSDAMDEFVRNGVAKYVEAQQTVSAFQDQLFTILEEALKRELAAGPVALAAKSDIRRPTGGARAEWWLNIFASVIVPGTDPTQVPRIELGVWWNPAIDPERADCVVYANLRDAGAGAKFGVPTDPSHARVRALPNPRWTRLCVTVGKPPDLMADATAVLAALQAGLLAPAR